MHCAQLDEAGLKLGRQFGHCGQHHGRSFEFNDLHRRPHGRFHLLAAHLGKRVGHSTRLEAGTPWNPARSASPRTTTPPDVFENALSVSAILFGSP